MVKHDQEVLRRAVELLKIGKSFAITGGSGLGKTTLARAIIKALGSPETTSFYGCHTQEQTEVVSCECLPKRLE